MSDLCFPQLGCVLQIVVKESCPAMRSYGPKHHASVLSTVEPSKKLNAICSGVGLNYCYPFSSYIVLIKPLKYNVFRASRVVKRRCTTKPETSNVVLR